jgi:hypothetical protein
MGNLRPSFPLTPFERFIAAVLGTPKIEVDEIVRRENERKSERRPKLPKNRRKTPS